MLEQSLAGVRVFLLDDHPAVREGLSLLLAQKGLVICGEADCRSEALRLLNGSAPDAVLLDLSLGSESGLDLIVELQNLNVTVIVYSMHDDAQHIRSALAVGARGYVTKREKASVLLETIAKVLAGERHVSPVAALALDEHQAVGSEQLMLTRLSERELEIFCLIGQGFTTADLAEHFMISSSTVETYYARIREKMGFSGTREMRRRAIRYKSESPLQK